MIEVEHLTKRYGTVTAVDDVSFRVNKGEILGFLGPNGAGKTTTMRVLTGYMPATDGRAAVAGYDVFDHPIEAKRRTGRSIPNATLSDPKNNPAHGIRSGSRGPIVHSIPLVAGSY